MVFFLKENVKYITTKYKMQRSLAIVALLIIAYLFTKMHQTQDERSTIGIWTMILVYVAVFEAADLIAMPLKKHITD
jgi:uncharacterized membrane protein